MNKYSVYVYVPVSNTLRWETYIYKDLDMYHAYKVAIKNLLIGNKIHIVYEAE